MNMDANIEQGKRQFQLLALFKRLTNDLANLPEGHLQVNLELNVKNGIADIDLTAFSGFGDNRTFFVYGQNNPGSKMPLIYNVIKAVRNGEFNKVRQLSGYSFTGVQQYIDRKGLES